MKIVFSIVLLFVCLLFIFSQAPATADESFELRTMTFNVRVDTPLDLFNSWSWRKHRVVAAIKDYQPDIIGIQEAKKHQIDYMHAYLAGYDWIGVGREGGTKGEYCVIFYRSDKIAVLDSGTFWLSNQPQTPGSKSWGNLWTRICTWGEFQDLKSGQRVYFYNIHLSVTSQNARQKSVEYILNRLQHPAIVVGDFNAGESNNIVRLMKKNGMRDSFREKYPRANGATTRSGGSKIDYIFVCEEIMTLDAEIMRSKYDRKYPSDHFPVTARVRIKR